MNMLTDDERSMLAYLAHAIIVAPDVADSLMNVLEKRSISDCATEELRVLRSSEDITAGVRSLTARMMR